MPVKLQAHKDFRFMSQIDGRSAMPHSRRFPGGRGQVVHSYRKNLPLSIRCDICFEKLTKTKKIKDCKALFYDGTVFDIQQAASEER